MEGIGFKQPRVDIVNNHIRITRPNPLAHTLAFHAMMNDDFWPGCFEELPTFPEMVDTRFKTLKHLAANYRGTLDGTKYYGVMTREQTGGMLGRISAWPSEVEDNALDIAYLVHPVERANGVATLSVGNLAELARTSGNVSALRAGITPDNVGAREVAVRNGFSPTQDIEVVGGVEHNIWRLDLSDK